MKICFVTEEFPPDTVYGGIAIYYGMLADELKKEGIDVYVITRNVNSKNCEYYESNERIIKISSATKKGTIFDRLFGYRISVYKALKHLCKSESIDVIEFPEWKAEAFFVFLFGLCNKIPSITIRLHGCRSIIRKFDGCNVSFSDKIVIAMEKYVLKKCRYVSAISRSVLAETEELMNIRLANKTNIIYNFVRTDDLIQKEEGNNKRVLLFAGRIDSLKGAITIAKIIDKVFEQYDDCEWHIAGRDILIPQYNQMGSKIILNEISKQYHDRVVFLGQITRDKLMMEYCQAYLTLLPSHYEAFGLCCAESMMCGTPVVAGENGGMAEIIDDGKDGFLIDPYNQKELLEKILFAFENKELINEMRTASKRKIEERFASRVVISEIIAYYKSIAAEEKKSV